MSNLIEKKRKEIIRIMKRNGVRKASIFGSFARGEYTRKSDVDILVSFERGRSLLDMSGLKIELEGLLKRKVDIVTYKSIDPCIKNEILSQQEAIL